MAKDYVMGLYQMAYSIYLVMIMVSTAGIPLAMSKLISERITLGDSAGVDQMYRVGARYLTVTGVVFFAIMYYSAGWLAVLMGDSGGSTAIRALSFALLIVPLLAAMRGYVQGHQLMDVSGNAQIIEQLVRVVTILFSVFFCVKMRASSQLTAAVATFGAAIGALVSLLFINRHVKQIHQRDRKNFLQHSAKSNKKVFCEILKVSIPITLTSLVLPLSQIVDSFTIINLLMYGFHWSKDVATSEYGIFTARALRLIALPLSVAVAVGTSVMPSISEAIAANNIKMRNERVVDSFRLTSFFSFPAAIGIYLLAGPIDIALFQDLNGANTIAMVSFMSIFASFEVVSGYILQSIGYMYRPVGYMFAGLGLKLILNLILVPRFGILGAASASVLGYVLSAVLGIYAIHKVTLLPFGFKQIYGKALFASLIMGGMVWIWTFVPIRTLLPWPRIANLALIFVGTLIGSLVFVWMMIWQKGISKHELTRIPIIRRFVGSRFSFSK
jgi:O-antigen/teichoic acid export membrane protein